MARPKKTHRVLSGDGRGSISRRLNQADAVATNPSTTSDDQKNREIWRTGRYLDRMLDALGPLKPVLTNSDVNRRADRKMPAPLVLDRKLCPETDLLDAIHRASSEHVALIEQTADEPSSSLLLHNVFDSTSLFTMAALVQHSITSDLCEFLGLDSSIEDFSKSDANDREVIETEMGPDEPLFYRKLLEVARGRDDSISSKSLVRQRPGFPSIPAGVLTTSQTSQDSNLLVHPSPLVEHMQRFNEDLVIADAFDPDGEVMPLDANPSRPLKKMRIPPNTFI